MTSPMEINGFDYSTFWSYATYATQYLNTKLVVPTRFLQSKLSLKTETLPENLRTPLNFSAIVAVTLALIITFANNLVCNVVGILYPLFYGLYIFNEQPVNTQRSVTLNKYWILFGVLSVVDSFFGFILHLVPGYFYLKIGIIYALIRNDFALTNVAFSMLESYYAKSDYRPKIETVLTGLNTKLAESKENVEPETEYGELDNE